MNIKMVIYAALAVLGLFWTAHFNVQAMNEGLGIGDFFTMGFVNPVSSSLTADLTVACLAFLVWMPLEARRLGMKHAWLYVVATFALAFAFSFPLFLLMRERKLSKDATTG